MVLPIQPTPEDETFEVEAKLSISGNLLRFLRRIFVGLASLVGVAWFQK